MSYAKSVLQPGETIIAGGRLHWIIYGWAIVCLAAGSLLLVLERRYGSEHDALIAVTAAAFGVLFLVLFFYAWFIRWITEFAVTNRRVIYKRGFIWRQTEEMNMDKVETVDVDQSILGRILGYGTIRILGTGQGIEGLSKVGSPIELRSAITAR